MQNKIVIRYQDGRVLKGVSVDFMPNKDRFHLVPFDTPPDAKPQDIHASDLKAVFFVKDYAGNAQYQDKKEFPPDKPSAGRKIKVVFKDGERWSVRPRATSPTARDFSFSPLMHSPTMTVAM